MTSVYERVWTIRGTVDVQDDIHLLPGHELRILGNTDGTYRIVVNEGDGVWESCQDLKEIRGADPTIHLPKGDSVTLKDGGPYHNAIRRFVHHPDAGSFSRLVGTLSVANSAADVTVWAPKSSETGREILILSAVHREGDKHQNGTGHGDWD